MPFDYFLARFGRKDQDGIEFRLRKRVKAEFKVKFVRLFEDENRTESADSAIGFIRDVSTGGVQIESRAIHPITSELRFYVQNSRFDGPAFDGAVRWVEQHEPAPHEKRLSTMGIQFTLVRPDFKKYIDQRIAQTQDLADDDPFRKALTVRFEEPEELFWEYTANLKKGRLYVPSLAAIEPGKTVKVLIKNQPAMDLCRIEGEVLRQDKRIFDPNFPHGILIKITKYDPADQKRFFGYLKRLMAAIDAPEVDLLFDD
jgi:PilZ domain